MKKKALNKTRQKTAREFKHFSHRDLQKLVRSPRPDNRLFAILLIRKQIEEGIDPLSYYSLAKSLVSDSNNDCRWQSLVVISELVEMQPDLVWDVVSKYGNSNDADMRMAIACVLLEHLIEYDFDTYFTKVRELIHKGRYKFIDTLESCGFFEISKVHRKRVQSFLTKAKRGLSRSQWSG
ncbi:MAG: hypothetical protein ABSF37_11455 [Sedimentisphaerales bacterium]|jgi:hypothetical protein